MQRRLSAQQRQILECVLAIERETGRGAHPEAVKERIHGLRWRDGQKPHPESYWGKYAAEKGMDLIDVAPRHRTEYDATTSERHSSNRAIANLLEKGWLVEATLYMKRRIPPSAALALSNSGALANDAAREMVKNNFIQVRKTTVWRTTAAARERLRQQ
jgi:hypothetical protein